MTASDLILLMPRDTKLAFIRDNVNKLSTKKKIDFLQTILDSAPNYDEFVIDKGAGSQVFADALSDELISYLYTQLNNTLYSIKSPKSKTPVKRTKKS